MRSPYGWSSGVLFGLGLGLALGLRGCRPAPDKGTTLVIESPEGDRDADVYVDGSYVGQISGLTEAGGTGIKLAPGVHRLEIRKPGRFPVQKTVRVDGNTPASLTINAELLEDPQ